MRNTRKQFLIISSLIAIVALAPTHFTYALDPMNFINIGFGVILQVINSILYVGFVVSSFFLTLTASALNVAMYLTTNLGIFIDNIPPIYTVWKILRDISVIFLIFLLLWEALKIILDVGKVNYKQTLFNIVKVGLLINFSFFFTTVLIDASNIVSLQLYNAIAPQTPVESCTTDTGASTYFSCVTSSITNSKSGGLSTVIVNSLDVTQWLGNKSVFSSAEGFSSLGKTDTAFRMILVIIGATFVTTVTAISLLAAAAAAIWRIAVLILLLAFSPLWIAGYALPEVNESVSKPWLKHLKANLVFLPVYLLLMYVVVTIIAELNLGAVSNGALTQIVTSAEQGNASTWYGPFLQLISGFAIIIFLVNVPLVTALSISGASGTYIDTLTKKIRGTVGGWAGGYASRFGRNTIGRASNSLAENRFAKSFAARSPIIGGAVLSGISKGASYGFGQKKGSYKDALSAKNKSYESTYKALGTVDKSNYANTEAGKLKLKEAEERAKIYQERFRNNINSTPGGIIGIMFDNRAGRTSAAKMNKDAEKSANKKAADAAKKELKDLNKQLAELKEDKSFIRLDEDQKRAKEEKIKKLEEEIQAKNDLVEKAKNDRDEERDEKLISKIENLSKKD